MAHEDYVLRVRDRLAQGDLLDVAFDRLLPWDARSKSMRHWTPLCVARQAARRFREHGVRRVLDVGCGPGKFCVAAAAAEPELRLCGVEQRRRLFEVAGELARVVGVANAEFELGDALALPWSEFQGFYFFNPFGEEEALVERTLVGMAPSPPARFGKVLLSVAARLSSLSVGSVVITYHGLGGPIPSSYDPVCEDLVGTSTLRTWVKARAHDADWYHVDTGDETERIARAELSLAE